MDIEGRFIDANASALNIFGNTKEELLEFPLNQLMNSAADKEEFRIKLRFYIKKDILYT